SKDGRITVTTTLFGTFVTDYPGAMPPDVPAELNVVFAPSVFSTDLWANDLSIGVIGYSSDIIRYVGLKEAFNRNNFVVVKGGESIRCTWTMRSPQKSLHDIAFRIR